MTGDSYDARFWQTQVRKNRPTPYRVRWVVNGQLFSDSFLTSGLADSFKAQLITAARKGEAFDSETGRAFGGTWGFTDSGAADVAAICESSYTYGHDGC